MTHNQSVLRSFRIYVNITIKVIKTLPKTVLLNVNNLHINGLLLYNLCDYDLKVFTSKNWMTIITSILDLDFSSTVDYIDLLFITHDKYWSVSQILVIDQDSGQWPRFWSLMTRILGTSDQNWSVTWLTKNNDHEIRTIHDVIYQMS